MYAAYIWHICSLASLLRSLKKLNKNCRAKGNLFMVCKKILVLIFTITVPWKNEDDNFEVK